MRSSRTAPRILGASLVAMSTLAVGTLAATVGTATAAAAADGLPAAGETVVLSEDFSSGEIPADWDVPLGDWNVVDGRLVGVSGGERSRVTFGESLPNYRFEADVEFIQVANSARWINMATDYNGRTDRGAVITVRTGTKASNGIEFNHNDTGSWITDSKAAAGIDLGTGTAHHLTVEVHGATETFSIDGVQYASTDAMFRSNPAGTLGFIINSSTVAFDNVKVTEIPAQQTAPGSVQSLAATSSDMASVITWTAPGTFGTAGDTGEPATLDHYEVAVAPTGTAPADLVWENTTETNHAALNLTNGTPYTVSVRTVSSLGLTGPTATTTATPHGAIPSGLPMTQNGGAWSTSHVQGIAVDLQGGYIYYTFTTLLVKKDFEGNLIGTMGGFRGHLGDLDFNEEDGRVYGSLEYKSDKAFYIAVIDVDQITEEGMDAQDSDAFKTVYLPEVVKDYSADMDGDGKFDGDTANTLDHRYGGSGIDGVSFGPAFGHTDGPQYLTVAYGIYAGNTRNDNDHQVLLQYDPTDWSSYESPLTEANPHHNGPAEVDGKYFIYTGNTNFGVQNLTYDDYLQRWFMGVYKGSKPTFPNYGMYAVEASTTPVLGDLKGIPGEQGMLIALADDGLEHEATGIRGWNQKADVGIQSLGHGLFYLSKDGTTGGKQTSDLTLNRWTGLVNAPFTPVTVADISVAPGFTAAAPTEGLVDDAYSYTFTAAGTPVPSMTVTDGELPAGLELDARTGVLSGTPETAGTYEFTVTADNGLIATVSEDVQLVVEAPAPTGPTVDVQASTRCMAGKVYLAVTALNQDADTISVNVTSAFGSKSFTGITTGKNAYIALATRATSTAAGTVKVVATDAAGSTTVDAPYAAATC